MICVEQTRAYSVGFINYFVCIRLSFNRRLELLDISEFCIKLINQNCKKKLNTNYLPKSRTALTSRYTINTYIPFIINEQPNKHRHSRLSFNWISSSQPRVKSKILLPSMDGSYLYPTKFPNTHVRSENVCEALRIYSQGVQHINTCKTMP